MEQIQNTLVDFYSDLWSRPKQLPSIDRFKVEEASPKRLNRHQQDALQQEVNEEEIKESMFSIKDDKAPGPDGYNSVFFKRGWSIVGCSVIKAIQSLFQSGRLLKEVDSTPVSLIPKVPNASFLKDFRPISCCNTFKSVSARFWLDM